MHGYVKIMEGTFKGGSPSANLNKSRDLFVPISPVCILDIAIIMKWQDGESNKSS